MSNDGQVIPSKEQGMNRMMYVEGNPLKWADKTGNKISTQLAWGLMGAVAAQNLGLSMQQGFALGYGFSKNQQQKSNNSKLRNTLDNTIGKNGLLGWTANNALSIRKINHYLFKFKHTYSQSRMGERRKSLSQFLQVACS